MDHNKLWKILIVLGIPDHLICLLRNLYAGQEATVRSGHGTMEYYSAIKKSSFESVLIRWMKLEPIIQSEVSQKDKDHYNILTHIYGI